MAKGNVVSIFFEVIELRAALEATRTLVIQLQEDPQPSRQARETQNQIGAVLSLAIQRAGLLAGAIEGVVDPALLLGRHNQVRTDEAPVIRDLRLTPWPKAPRRHG